MQGDTYYTIEKVAEAQYSEKRSKFLAFVVPVKSPEEALEVVDNYRKKYYDARHVCWAYRIGEEGVERSNDDGEPSGTAGKPILGRLLSADLSDIVAIVVRYFGGIKLGTSGLIVAYKSATELAIEEAVRKPVTKMIDFEVAYGYDLMGEVMRYVKEYNLTVVSQECLQSCSLHLRVRANDFPEVKARFESLYGCSISSLKKEDE